MSITPTIVAVIFILMFALSPFHYPWHLFRVIYNTAAVELPVQCASCTEYLFILQGFPLPQCGNPSALYANSFIPRNLSGAPLTKLQIPKFLQRCACPMLQEALHASIVQATLRSQSIYRDKSVTAASLSFMTEAPHLGSMVHNYKKRWNDNSKQHKQLNTS